MPETLVPGLERRLKASVRARCGSTPSRAGAMPPTPRTTRSCRIGVVAPRTIEEAEHGRSRSRARRASACCRAAAAPRSAGQTVNASLVIDCSKYLDRLLELDVAGRRCVVEPGIVLDELNRALKPHGLWFPVDISTASRATIGGMVGNNSCGARSLRYGNTRENVLSIDADPGRRSQRAFRSGGARPLRPAGGFAAVAARARPAGARRAARPTRSRRASRRCSAGSAATISTRCVPGRNDLNLAHILVGSEGTLALLHRDRAEALAAARTARGRRLPFRQLLSRRWTRRSTSSSSAPIAVELVDRTMLELAREIAMFEPTHRAVRARRPRGDPVRRVRARTTRARTSGGCCGSTS